MIHYLPLPLMSERIRTTISLSPESYAIFKRMADAGNMSVSRCMGDWLADTAEAAELITTKMEEAKRAPLEVVKEMRALVAGLASSVDEAEGVVRRSQANGPASADQEPGSASVPPCGNTGVLVPPTPSKPKRVVRPVKNWKVL